MTAIDRKPIFDAAKRRGAVFRTLADVEEMDSAIDAAVAPLLAAEAPKPWFATVGGPPSLPAPVAAPAPPEPRETYPRPISLVDAALLAKVVPARDDLDQWAAAIRKACLRFEINTVRRVAAFIAQMAHESGLTIKEENLNYSAKRLTQVWPSRFPMLARAEPYARNPEKLANKVYSGRMGNGDEASGDGWRFRGAGPLQLTGRSNWSLFAKALGLTLDDALEYGRTVEGGIMAAAWFWEANDINRLADTPGVADESKRINGGTHGLEDRKAKFDALVSALIKAGA